MEKHYNEYIAVSHYQNFAILVEQITSFNALETIILLIIYVCGVVSCNFIRELVQ